MILRLSQGESVGVNQNFIYLALPRTCDGVAAKRANDKWSAGIPGEVHITGPIPLTIDVDLQRRVIDHDHVLPLTGYDSIAGGCRGDVEVGATRTDLAAHRASRNRPDTVALHRTG